MLRFEARTTSVFAGVAQLVEQLIRNQQVIGSSPIAGSSFARKFSDLLDRDSQAYFASNTRLTPRSLGTEVAHC